MTTKIFLIRHGTTSANKENRFAGRTGEALHPEGSRQIKEVGLRMQGERISKIFSGPLVRTKESAKIFSDIFSVDYSIDENFNEIYLPHWDGLTKMEIREKFGPEYPTWLESPDKFHVPGCETLADVQGRAVRSIEKIFATFPGENILVVSHLIVIRCLVLHSLKKPIREFRSISIDNGSVTCLSRNTDGMHVHSLQI